MAGSIRAMDREQNNDLKARLEALRSEGVLAVACPTCGSEGSFHRPFAWLTGEEAQRAKADAEIIGVAESRGYVVELYPEVFLWSDPERSEAGGSTGHRIGVLRCASCGHHDKHRIRWPQDLYFQVSVEGRELAAYTREHAEENLDHLEMLIAVPTVLRAFFVEQLPARLPEGFTDTTVMAHAIAALRHLLGRDPEDVEEL